MVVPTTINEQLYQELPVPKTLDDKCILMEEITSIVNESHEGADTQSMRVLLENLPTRRGDRDEAIDYLAENYFNEEEKNIWDHDTRRGLVALISSGFIDFMQVNELDRRVLVVRPAALRDTLFPWKNHRREITQNNEA